MSKIFWNVLRFKNSAPKCVPFALLPRRMVQTDKSETTIHPTMQQLRHDLAKTMGVERGYKPVPPSRTHLSKYIPDIKDLPARSMQDSYLVGMIPLSTSEELQEKYITYLGSVRLGRLLEDMDIFAVMVAQKHIFTPTIPKDIPSPFSLVTAHVDTIEFTDYIPKPNQDIKISGHVSWVGKSSMEIVVWLEQNAFGTWNRITRALFLIVARDPSYVKGALVNPMMPATKKEAQIFSGGEERKKQRIAFAKKMLSKSMPTMEELQVVHDLYTKTLGSDTLQEGKTNMKDLVITNCMLSHPEDRNLHNTIFGGFLMRLALEISWIMTCKFAKSRPNLKCMSNIVFHEPVIVGSLIKMTAYVVYTHLNYVQIMVICEVSNLLEQQAIKSTSFHFTYECQNTFPMLVPTTYHEAMLLVEGRRHFNEVIKRESAPKAYLEPSSIPQSKL